MQSVKMNQLESISYDTYVLALTVPHNQIQAFSLPSILMSFVKEVKDILRGVSEETGQSVEALLHAFKSKDLFTLFKSVGFSVFKLYKAVRHFLTLIPKGIIVALKELEDSKVLEALSKGTMKVDEFFARHPVLKLLIGPALAGFLIWIWMNGAFTGDPNFDLDLSSITGAFTGHFSVEDLFSGHRGLVMLASLAAGFSGIGVAWLGDNLANFVLALLYTGARKAKESKLAVPLKKLLKPVHIKASTIEAEVVEAQSLSYLVTANGLDALRAIKLLTHLGIRGVELQDSSTNFLTFTVTAFDSTYHKLADFYGKAKNESNQGWATKRLIWTVPEVKGQVMLMQVGNATPLLIFRQL